MVSELSALMIRLYAHYDNGYLPDSGGILDQDNFILASFEILQHRLNDDS